MRSASDHPSGRDESRPYRGWDLLLQIAVTVRTSFHSSNPVSDIFL